MKGKKLKILAASDIHGDSKLTKKLASRAEKENVDLVVLCGDITGFVETKEIIKPFKERNKKVLIIPGNHDAPETIEFLSSLYNIKNIHGYSVKYERVGIFGAGGANIGPEYTPDIDLLKIIKKAHDGIKSGIEKKIMVTHMHPKGSISELSGLFPGSKSIAKAIKEFKPDVLLHGHIHETAGVQEMIKKTRVINVGRNGTIIEI